MRTRGADRVGPRPLRSPPGTRCRSTGSRPAGAEDAPDGQRPDVFGDVQLFGLYVQGVSTRPRPESSTARSQRQVLPEEAPALADGEVESCPALQRDALGGRDRVPGLWAAPRVASSGGRRGNLGTLEWKNRLRGSDETIQETRPRRSDHARFRQAATRPPSTSRAMRWWRRLRFRCSAIRFISSSSRTAARS